jgi:double-strand break repair protein MRE11
MGEFSLQEQHSLDPDDPKVEQKVKQILKEQVELLIHQAKRKARELRRAAKENANVIAQATEYPLSNQLEKPDEVLVRLKVEHGGFSALNNQRFGAQFIGQVGNPVSLASNLI